ncbi:MAG: hypothetical protein AAFZ07_29615, partial [Actinomycetota bacterium]
LNASGDDDGEKGGKIVIKGEQVRFLADASLIASGRAGGGQVIVGAANADDPSALEPGASQITIEEGAWIAADGTVSGDGGFVYLAAEEFLEVLGTVSARGGVAGGDGGEIQVASEGTLAVGQAPDAGARSADGSGGLLKLEAPEFEIAGQPTVSAPDGTGVSGLGADVVADALETGQTVEIVATGATEANPDAVGDLTVADAIE